MKATLLKISNYASIAFLATMIATGGLYLHESRTTIDDYILYHGHISQFEEYTSPVDITMYTFGHNVETVKDVSFYNELLCAPTDASFYSLKFIGDRVATYHNWRFQNDIPEPIHSELVELGQISQIGTVMQRDIRELVSSDNDFVPWSMGELLPDVSSECYVSSHLTIYTPIFKIPKTTVFKGNKFVYTVETDKEQ